MSVATTAAATAVGGLDAEVGADQLVGAIHLGVLEEGGRIGIDHKGDTIQIDLGIVRLDLIETHLEMGGATAAAGCDEDPDVLGDIRRAGLLGLLQLFGGPRGHGDVHWVASFGHLSIPHVGDSLLLSVGRAATIAVLALVLAGCGGRTPGLVVSCRVRAQSRAAILAVTVRANRGTGHAILYGRALEHVRFVRPPLRTVSVIIRSHGRASGSFPGWIIPHVRKGVPGHVKFVVSGAGHGGILATRRAVVSALPPTPDCTAR